MTSALKSSLRNVIAYFAFWTMFGLFMFSQGAIQKIVSRDPSPWWHRLASWMVGVYLWFLLTPLILWLGRRLNFDRRHWRRWVAIHIALGVAIAFLELISESAISRLIGIFPSFRSTLTLLLMIDFHQSFLMYWGIIAAQYGVNWYRKYEESKQEALQLELRSSQLQSQLAQAHLSALKMQIQPHFLFNTLNAIMVLVRQEKGHEAEEMLGRLSDLLRCVLEDVDAQEVPLRRELEYLRLYLGIEQVRFQDRLVVEIAADPETLDAAVPHMVLQPLVENAIRHGIGRRSSAGRIRISACRVNGSVKMKIQDDGPGLDPGSHGKIPGIGLANTRARLSQLYRDAASLTIEDDSQSGVAATVILPFRMLTFNPKTDFMETHAVLGSAG
jgi:two-component system, LytTR family, sensor kinase